jgi:3-oxoacyl-[acyl-carrier protein] reductase
MELKGRKTIITGSGRGIGRAIALAFAKEGADIGINDVNLSDAGNVAKEVSSLGRKAVVVKTDVSNYDEVGEMIKKFIREMGRIDILVNNAGVASQKKFIDMEKKEWDWLIGIVMGGAFNCCRHLVNHMIEQKYGRIINISSIFGICGWPEMAHYSAAKSGLIAFTKALSKEVAQFGITVNTIAPGNISTPMHKTVPQEVIDEIVRMTPVGRLGQPEEIAEVCVYLASEKASYMTGQLLSPNGGILI